MLIKNLFKKDIFRPINGVVKADQLDETSVWQELDEFVVTRELDTHLRQFFSSYLDAVDHPTNAEVMGKTGVWISGFFGSGKSHLLKGLSFVLKNDEHCLNGTCRKAVEFFDSKITDAMLLGDIKRAVAANADVILFNIDSKADHRSGRDAILWVFLKVLNELQGYSGDHPHIAHLERYLESKGKLQAFQEAYRKHTGLEWLKERDAYQFNRDEVVKAVSETLGQSQGAAEKWIDGAEDNFAVTVENFCKWVKAYLDSKGTQHHILFLVDEVGQFIGTDSHLMLNLQTITEDLGTICKGRAWIVVTSQEDIDAVLGEMKTTKANDFSKIQGRFKTRLSLSSSNADEVIQYRLLFKDDKEVIATLESLFKKKGDILKHQLTFSNCGTNFRPFKDSDDFVKNYPFAPYQFQLVQKIFEAIRKAGATGMHLARGERSMLDAFQSAAKTVAVQEVGILVPLYEFYPSIESFLDTAVKKTIDQAKDNSRLEKFDIRLLQVLFLIRYVDEMKGNVDNLVTLCLDQIDADRLALRRRIEESLGRLESQTLVSRSGDLYFFLTNEERDINKEIKNVDLTSGEDSRLLGEIIFNDVLKEKRKHCFSSNKMNFEFNRRCDEFPVGNQKDNALLFSVVSPLADDYESFGKEKCLLTSSTQGPEGGFVLVHLHNDDSLGRELRTYVQTDKYLKRKDDTAQESTKRIHASIANDNQARRERLTKQISQMLAEADYYAAGQILKLKTTQPQAALEEAMEYLIQNTFSKMSFLKRLIPEGERLKEIQSVLRSNDLAKQTMMFQSGENNPQAIEDVRSYVELSAKASRSIILHDMIEKRYALRPYGWPDDEVVLLIARLLVLGDISLMMDGALLPLDRAYENITAPAKRRKITVIRRQTSKPEDLKNARNLGKELFAEMGPDGEDALFSFLQTRLKEWQANLNTYKTLADTGNYPGKEDIGNGLQHINKLLKDTDSSKFIERFNLLRKDLADFAEQYHELEHFFTHQKQTWEKLRKANDSFQPNRLDLERDPQAGPAFRRIGEILAAPAPFGLLKDAEDLVATVSGVNSNLLTKRRQEAIARIDGQYGTLTKEIAAVQGDAALKTACIKPLENLKQQVTSEQSLAHIGQAEAEAVKEFDAALGRIHEFTHKKNNGGDKTAKKQRVIKPADLVKTPFLETKEEVDVFLSTLRQELEKSLNDNERIQIR